MSKKHALLSPSAADRWMVCPGSVWLTKDIPDEPSPYAAEGSCAHEVAEQCLKGGLDPMTFVGKTFYDTVVDEDMARHVQTYIDAVRDYQGDAGELHVEVPLDISTVTGEPDAIGTSDAVILRHADQEIVVGDLKYGYNKVSAIGNRQLRIYAKAVWQKYELIGDWQQIRIVIVQPRAGGVSEWLITVDELLAFGEEVKQRAAAVEESIGVPTDNLQPDEKACKYCRARATCPALRAQILSDFEALPAEDIGALSGDALLELYGRLPLIESWCKAIGDEVFKRTKQGEMPGFKLVEGKRGNRAWSKADEVEAMMKSMRLTKEEMYDMKLISPTTAEKRFAKDHPRQWEKLNAFVTQKAGSPTVAPESDPRPAVSTQVGADEFDPV